MKKWLTYLLFTLNALLGYAQPADWIDSTTNSLSTFFFPAYSLRSENGSIILPAKGDAVAIFSKQAAGVHYGKYRCVGMTHITTDTFTLVAYAKVGGSSSYGFDSGQQAYLLYWSASIKCYFELKTSTNPIFLKPKTSTRVDTARLIRYTVSYPRAVYNKDSMGMEEQIVPIVPTALSSVLFKSSQISLALDSNSGTITPSYSDTGLYAITLETQGCLVSNTVQIAITSSKPRSSNLDISGLTYAKTDPTCTKPGSIAVDVNSVKGNAPFKFILTSTSSHQSFSNTTGYFDHLPEGIYQLQVADSLDSLAVYPTLISLLRSEDCSNPVLAPDSKSGLETLYIEAQGSAKILDREGKVVKEMSVPNNWDGTDNTGKGLPMGDYYLFVNGSQSKVITIIR